MNKKVVIWISSIAIVLLTVLGFGLIAMEADNEMPSIQFTGNVTVEDGVPNPDKECVKFIVEKDGEYFWNYNWKGEPGIITGMSIISPEGEAVFACTADWCYAQSVAMELEEGIYEVEVTYITNTDAFNLFLTEHGMEKTESDDYEYAANGTWNMEYTVSLEKSIRDTVFKIIFVISVAIGLLLVAIILAVTKNGDKAKCKFDERQELVRGRGFKYGFFTMMISSGILIALNALEVTLFDNSKVAMLLSIVLGVSVFASYCIWNDGYFALNENRGKLLVILGFCGLLNTAVSISNIIHGNILENGALTFSSGNLFIAIIFVAIFIVMLLKHIKDGKED